MQTLFSTVRTVAHPTKIIAILKLPKLALCPLPTIMTQSHGGWGDDKEEGDEKIFIPFVMG